MTDKPTRGPGAEPGKVFHLPKARKPPSAKDELLETISSHFREQNEILRVHNQEQRDRIREQGDRLKEQGERIQRLTNGVERLVAEMHGVRTGKKEEAFARVGGMGAAPDLPTISAEAALIYTQTSKQIGLELGFHASQIGLLLSAKGLRWAGDGDYQEIGRSTSPSHSKFWHREVPERLRRVLDENRPEKYGITDKSVLAVFRRWKERHAKHELLESLEPTGNPN